MTPFTLAAYADLLALSLELGYRFCPFATADVEAAGESRVFLRHDIDFGPRYMSAMSDLEAEATVQATYCIQVDSPWYRIEDSADRAAIQGAISRGHWLGVHVDASRIASDDEVADLTVRQARELEAAFDAQVRAVSFHMPGRREVGHVELPEPLVNTYAPRFFTEIAYASDSNQSWRGTDVPRLLRDRAHGAVQLLVHPFWWREHERGLLEKLSSFADDRGVGLDEVVTPEQLALMEGQESLQRPKV